MKVVLNGETSQLTNQSVQSLIDELFPKVPVAVAINGQFVPRSAFADTPIHDGDRIEVLSPKQGG